MVTSAVNAMVLYTLEKMFLRSTGTVVRSTRILQVKKISVTGMSDRRQSTFFSPISGRTAYPESRIPRFR